MKGPFVVVALEPGVTLFIAKPGQGNGIGYTRELPAARTWDSMAGARMTALPHEHIVTLDDAVDGAMRDILAGKI